MSVFGRKVESEIVENLSGKIVFRLFIKSETETQNNFQNHNIEMEDEL